MTRNPHPVCRATDSGRQAAEVNPITGRVTNTTNSIHINDRARDLRSHLGEQNPAYANVTQNYADEMALRDALARGGDVGKLTAPEIEAQLRHMPATAREGWAAGARTALADTATQAGLRPTANIAQAVRRPLGLSAKGSYMSAGDAAKQAAIETMAGRPGAIGRLDDRLEAESQAFRTYADASNPGRTVGALSDAAGYAGTALDVVRKVSHGNLPGALASIVFQGNPRGTLSYRTDVQDRIAKVLTETAPQDVAANLGALANRKIADKAKSAARYRQAGTAAKVGVLQAAGMSTDPIASTYEDTETPPAPIEEDAFRPPAYRRRMFQ